MKIKVILKASIMSLLLLLSSCRKETTEYEPMTAYMVYNDVLLAIEDASGADLLADEGFVSHVELIGRMSGTELPFELKRVVRGGVEKTYLSFKAELPDAGSMVDVNEYESVGTSALSLSVYGQDLPLSCSYRFSRAKNAGSAEDGTNGIFLEKISYKESQIDKYDNHQYYNALILCLNISDNRLY